MTTLASNFSKTRRTIRMPFNYTYTLMAPLYLFGKRVEVVDRTIFDMFLPLAEERRFCGSQSLSLLTDKASRRQ